MKKKKSLLELFSIFFMIALFLAVYVLLEMRGDGLAILGSIAVLIIASYLFIDTMIDYRNAMMSNQSEGGVNQNLKQEADSSEIINIQKAIYTVIKRTSAENQDILRNIEERQTDLLRELEQLAEMLEQTSGESNMERRMLQTEQSILDVLKIYRQEQQAGIKSVIKYNKENAKQIAENEHTNTEMLLVELRTMLETVLTGIPISENHTLSRLPQEVQITALNESKIEAVPDYEAKALSEAAETEAIPDVPIPETEVISEAAELDTEIVPEPEAEEPNEIPEALQQLMSDDPNKALTPDEIAAMFAAAGN